MDNVLAFLSDHQTGLLSLVVLAIELFLRKKPGAKPILQKTAEVLTTVDKLLDAVPGLKNVSTETPKETKE